jgi:organic radical activating enzyme
MELPISIGSLVLEITRRCNMRCDHCMRGEAEALDMNFEIIDKLFESGIRFNDVTFTGGEPALFPQAIQYFVDRLKDTRREIDRFYVKTNGKHESMRMATALLELYGMSDSPEMCALDVSRDQFHEGYDNPELYAGLRFYHESDSMYADEGNYKTSQILSEGLAYDNGFGKGEQRNSEFVFEEYDEETINIAMMQVAANGNICGQCDISFDREDEDTYGNILEKDVNLIINEAYEKDRTDINEAA